MKYTNTPTTCQGANKSTEDLGTKASFLKRLTTRLGIFTLNPREAETDRSPWVWGQPSTQSKFRPARAMSWDPVSEERKDTYYPTKTTSIYENKVLIRHASDMLWISTQERTMKQLSFSFVHLSTILDLSQELCSAPVTSASGRLRQWRWRTQDQSWYRGPVSGKLTTPTPTHPQQTLRSGISCLTRIASPICKMN